MPDIKIFNPVELRKPRSPYMQVARVKTSEFAFIAGQVSVDASGTLIGHGDFEAQCAQVFANIHAALRSVGAEWRNVVEFPTMFSGGGFPPNTLLVIERLAHESYLLEIQTIAAL